MTTNAKTFRLFISSTFNDFKLERQVLHEKVFPVIDNYCIERGYTFQPVDLRWGVNDEAQLDQKTLDLCLNEVRACKHYPYPNFLIMLGNRYGWVSLPYAIKKDEFESILKFYEDNNETINMLEEWYIEDRNYLIEDSHAYVIKERDPKGAYKEWKEWEKVENQLRDLLQKAAKKLLKENTAQYNKYFMSATEAEVEEGIFNEINKDYVYGFIRTIKDHEKADLENEPAKSFIDQDQTNVTAFRKKLIDTLGEPHLLTDILDDFNDVSNVALATVSLSDQKKKIFTEDSYLKAFELFMIEKLTAAVDKQIEEVQNASALDQERSEQLRFKSLKIETFFGRKDELEQVQDYVNNTTTTQPFMVHGISGIGKSSFIAKAIDQTEALLTPSVAYRFIGATASSSNIRTLLESLIMDLADQGVVALPEAFEENSNKFNEQIKELLSDIEQPTVIVLDALDQLQHKDYLQWLPLELKSNLKIILSMLDQKGYEHYYDLLKNKIGTNNQLEISPIDEGVANEILDALLKKEKRTLTSSQKEYVLKQFHASHSSPLYLKIAFEEVRTWKSTDTTETLSVGIREIIKEFIDNLTEKFHHDRTIVHKVLGLISASRDGLSEKEILDLLSRDEDILKSLEKFTDLTLEIDGQKVRRFPISIWARLSEQLRPFMNEKLIDGQNLITFFHRQIDEAVKDYIYESNKNSLHTELAEYFLTLQDKEQTWNERYYNLHMLDEVPYQLFHSKNSTKLKEILFDLEFAGSVYDHHKQVGFREIMEKASELDGITEDDIYPWESFYREKEHLITRVNEERWSPHQTLFQMAYEDGENSPLSDEADILLQHNKIQFIWCRKLRRDENFKRTGLITVLQGHSTPLRGVKIGNDRILSWSEDEIGILWDSKGNYIESFTDYVAEDTHKIFHLFSNNKFLQKNFKNELSLEYFSGKTKKNDILDKSVNGFKILKCERFLSYSDDGTLKLWNSDGVLLKVLEEGHTDSIRGINELRDGRLLSYSDDGILKLWNSDGVLLKVLEEGHTDSIRGINELRDGRLLSYSDDEIVKLWSREGILIADFEGGPWSCEIVEELPNGYFLSTGPVLEEVSFLRLWNNEGKFLKDLEKHDNYIIGFKVIGQYILSYSGDATIVIWDYEGEFINQIMVHDGEVIGIDIIDNSHMLTYSEDKTLKIWDIATMFKNITLDEHTPLISNTKELSNGRLLSYTVDGIMKLWNSDGVLLKVLEDGHTGNVDGIKALSNGRFLSYSDDGILKLWNNDGVLLKVLEDGHTDSISGINELRDGRLLSYSRMDLTLRLWNSDGTLLRIFEKHIGWKGHQLSNGRFLSYSLDKTLNLWNSDGTLFKVLLEGYVDDIRWGYELSNGNFLLCSFEETLSLWNSDGVLLTRLGHKGRILRVYELSDGKFLLHPHKGSLSLWNSDGVFLTMLEHEENVTGVKVLSDGRFLSYPYSDEGILSLWNGDGVLCKVLDECTGDIKWVKELSDGIFLSYSGDYYSVDGTLTFWSNDGKKIKVIYVPKHILSITNDMNIITSDYFHLATYSPTNFKLNLNL